MDIGRIFNLDAVSMLEILRGIERIGEIKIVRTAGLDVIRILSDKDFMTCVNEYYQSLSEDI